MPRKKQYQLSDIIPNPNNPRLIQDEKLDKLIGSIKDFPKMMELRPIILDENNVILGGNMRFKALKKLGYKEVPAEWIKKAADLSEEEKRQFIIKDNVGFGEWDWILLANEWDGAELQEFGLELDFPDIIGMDDIETADDFALPDGDREPFQKMTFTLADDQAEAIKESLEEAKEDNNAENFGNENSNGNALYRIILEWAEQRI